VKFRCGRKAVLICRAALLRVEFSLVRPYVMFPVEVVLIFAQNGAMRFSVTSEENN